MTAFVEGSGRLTGAGVLLAFLGAGIATWARLTRDTFSAEMAAQPSGTLYNVVSPDVTMHFGVVLLLLGMALVLIDGMVCRTKGGIE